ncbi:MAG: hypothetical protein JNK72_14725 [Myxococcales bacterium]|nr:hypothetical protein [Myxococcales bacterium]
MNIVQIAIGAAVGVGVAIAMQRQARNDTDLGGQITAALERGGAMTLPALQTALQMEGFLKRGKVVMALNALISAGKVELIEAPEGTPQLEKVNHHKYQLKAAA